MFFFRPVKWYSLFQVSPKTLKKNIQITKFKLIVKFFFFFNLRASLKRDIISTLLKFFCDMHVAFENKNSVIHNQY